MNNSLQNRVVSAILDADRVLANQIIDDWTALNGFDNVMMEVISPVLNEIGNMYAETCEFSLAQGYVASKVAEDTFSKLASHMDIANPKVTKGAVVLGNIEDDFHPLGRKMVGIFLQTEGWQIYDLGLDVTPKEFIEKALEVDARVIGVSAMIYTTALNIKRLREEIDIRGLKDYIQLAVGGAVFKLRPDLVKEVGGDGTAESALTSPALFEDLWDASIKKGDIR